MSGGFGETSYDQLQTWRNVWRAWWNWLWPFIDLEKCLVGLVKLVMTGYRLEVMSGEFSETGFLKIPPPPPSSSLVLNATCWPCGFADGKNSLGIPLSNSFIFHYLGNFSFGNLTNFKSNTIVDFIENAIEHSRSGRYLFFLHRRPVLGPMRVQLIYPVSRFKRVQSLQHNCRFVLTRSLHVIQSGQLI